jgi:hypothetical protein
LIFDYRSVRSREKINFDAEDWRARIRKLRFTLCFAAQGTFCEEDRLFAISPFSRLKLLGLVALGRAMALLRRLR